MLTGLDKTKVSLLLEVKTTNIDPSANIESTNVS